MANVEQSEESASSQLLLREAEEHYAGALGEILTLRRALRERVDVSETEVKRVTGNYTRATQTLFDERKKVEEIGRRNRGIVNDYAIDFDAIRGEIGGQLDRLRAHIGPNGVSEWAE
ncbi:hypothetical protein [Oceaniglobus ichthyenteri]|uniref:hypothetical protein n=1 Tax=Oceaniglobus ichthyenteri TaxID=2136177 RepID=UPI0013DDA2A8|nr:hypothetical protein [Oceaniglobus ichthyenteri]